MGRGKRQQGATSGSRAAPALPALSSAVQEEQRKLEKQAAGVYGHELGPWRSLPTLAGTLALTCRCQACGFGLAVIEDQGDCFGLGRPQNADCADLLERAEEWASDECVCPPATPGILYPHLTGGDEAHDWVERCDSCQRYGSDEEAALALVERLPGARVGWAQPQGSSHRCPYVEHTALAAEALGPRQRLSPLAG